MSEYSFEKVVNHVKVSGFVYPGSEIVVSAKKKREGGMTAAQLVSLGSATTSLATVVLALMNVLK